MFTRRLFSACALCSLTGFSSIEASAADTNNAVQRKILQRSDGPMEGYETVLVEAVIAPNFLIALHTHPGTESLYCVAGGGTLSVKDKGDQATKTGTGAQVAAHTPHKFQNGDASTTLAITYVVEKGKPLISPA